MAIRSELLEAGLSDGPALVLLHGWGASKESWKLIFRPPLTDHFHLIALDLPGTGGTPAAESATMPGLADWVAAKVSALGCERFHLLGHSMGGNVAANLAVRYPHRVGGLVLVAPALQSDRLVHANWYLHPLTGAAILAGARCAAGLAGWLESRLPPTDDLGWHRGYMRRSGYLTFNNTLEGLQAQLRGLLDGPFDATHLSETLPLLLIHGSKDTTIPLSWAREVQAVRPKNTSLLVYQEALHCPMDTHTSRFVNDVTSFLRSVDDVSVDS
jgi:pimeloyl-ACP methyl ester carboxylesterase